VEIHRHHVMQKMQVRSAVELVRLLSTPPRKDACAQRRATEAHFI